MRNFEPFVQHHLKVFVQKWDEIAVTQAQPDGFANVEGRVWLK